MLKNFFYAIYEDAHNFVQVRLKAKMALVEAMYIRQCCDIITGLLSKDEGEEVKNYTDKQLERLFLFAVMWSLGAVLELDDRAKLEEFVLSHPAKLEWPKVHGEQSVFEFLVGDDGKWQNWSDRVEEFEYPSDSVLEFSSILVPNIDNVRSAFLIHLIAKQNKAVLFIGNIKFLTKTLLIKINKVVVTGEQGTAKTVMIKSYLSGYDPDFQISKSINFSSATSPNMFQVQL